MTTRTRTRSAVVVVLAVLAVVFGLVEGGSVAQLVCYQVVALSCIALAVIGLRVNRPCRALGWGLFIGALSLFWIGDALWLVAVVRGVDPFPSWADVFYLAGYPVMAAGLAVLVRGRQPGGQHTALVDAAIVSTGAAVVTFVFLIMPLAENSGETLLGRIVVSAYPVGDLLLLAILVRLWSMPGRRTASFGYLVGSLLTLVVADTAFAVTTAVDPQAEMPLLDAGWLVSYLLSAAVLLHPSVVALSEPAPRCPESLTRRRLGALTAASMLAPGTLLLEVALGRPVHAVVVGVGSMLLFGLVVLRMAGLLHQVQVQAVQLGALARNDHLTGIPNRRTWDHELSRACAAARDQGTALCVAMIDLDRFKAFNDMHGHPAGDLLLQEATAAWALRLGPEVMLARYGGEEFAVLMPGLGTDEARALLEALRPICPAAQTFSAGVARWDPAESPAAVVARADGALYVAKAGGRDRIEVDASSPAPAPGPRAVRVPATRAGT